MTPRRLFGALTPLALFGAFTALAADSSRIEIPLSSGWRFHFGDVAGLVRPDFDDQTWSQIQVPHTWNAFDGQDGVKAKGTPMDLMKGDYARGDGWYRLSFPTQSGWANRRVYLQFDGANRTTRVYLNGRFIGKHVGGNARFRFDVTENLAPSGSNELVVCVDNRSGDSIPVSADFTFFGGLYRPVSLLVTDRLHIETMDFGSPGVFLEQKAVSADSAAVEARVEVANYDAKPVDARVRVSLSDATGTTVAQGTASTSLQAGEHGAVTLPLSITQPHLWNGRADPYLYKATITVLRGDEVTDSIEQPLGLRFFRVDPKNGFFLNGHYLDLHGVSRHQDRQDKGWAISPEDDREDFGLIKEIGATAIRVAHYQQSQIWYQLADENGLVLWSEVPFVDEAIGTRDFYNNAMDQMRELIRQNYNHPSICFWGCGNENGDAGTNFVERIARYAPISERLIQAFNALAHSEDPTRLTTYASFHSENDVDFKMPGASAAVHVSGEPQRWYTDVTDFNKYFGWYYGEAADAGKFFDELHARYPKQPIGVSEYGAGAALSQHDATAYGTDVVKKVPMNAPRPIAFARFHPEEYQAYYHEETWKAFKERPYLWSKFVWNMFDFASDGRNEGDAAGRNDKGLVSYDRKIRKDAFYFYKANWSTEPVLYITGRRFVKRTAATTAIKVYSSAPKVEAFLNGTSLGVKEGSDFHVFIWDTVTLVSGANHVEVRAAVPTGTLTDSCQWDLSGPSR